ncbi:MAG: HAD hydrolase-like protein [Erysipelotrichaceae bacterium]|nr:HAD hydrolase-like protein [Erysipelotrichaceae bacterium]
MTRFLKTNYPFPLSFSSLYLALSQSFFSRCDRPFEETAQDVYWHYQEYIPESEESFVTRLKQTFIQAECENIEIDPIAVKVVKQLREIGKQVFLFSDYYLGKEFFLLLFDEWSLSSCFSGIYSSADYRKTKEEGTLYEEIFAPEAALMIGDNPKADIEMAKAHHLDAFQVTSTKESDRYDRFDENYDKQSLRQLFALRSRKKNYFVANYGYLLYLSLRKLYGLLKPNDVVFFLARDGAFLKTCFDTFLTKENQKGISTVYLPTSRLALLIASLDVDSLTPKSLCHLLSTHSQWSVSSSKDLLTELGFEAKEWSERIGPSPYRGSDYFSSAEYADLVSSSWFRLALKQKQKEAIQKFHALISPLKNQRLITVDLGWQGTAQNDMRKILDQDIDLIGYYIATTYCVGELPRSKKIGLWFDYFDDAHLKDDSFYALESLLKTDQGQLICYRSAEDLYLPDNGKKVYETYSKPRQEECLRLFQQLMALDQKHPFSEEDLKACFDKVKKKETIANIAQDIAYYCYQNGDDTATKPGFHDFLYGCKVKGKNAFPNLYRTLKRFYRKRKR